jgi:hypothetical protein
MTELLTVVQVVSTLAVAAFSPSAGAVTPPPSPRPVARPAARPSALPAMHPVLRPMRAGVPAVTSATVVARGVTVGALTETVQRYCGQCHNPTSKRGNLDLRGYSVEGAATDAAVTEKMIRKLRTDMMPPPGSRRPKGDTLLALVETLETVVDNAAPVNPGRRTFQRLNRAEYERVVRDLLGLTVNAGDWLPLDTKSANFDNVSDVQALSPTLLEGYLNAAAAISRMAVGDRTTGVLQAQYKTSPFQSQHPWDRVPGTPYGTRGGMAFTHSFPADGEYVFKLNVGGGVGRWTEDLDISVDGERVALLHYDRGLARNGESADAPSGADYFNSAPIKVKAGQRSVSVAFVRTAEGPYEDLIKPHDWSRASSGTGAAGTTEPPPLMEVMIVGPDKVTGISDDAPARRALFRCKPAASAAAAVQRACAEQILTGLATRAYRRPLTATDRAALLRFYDRGASSATGVEGFEAGVRMGVQAVLASPHFVFRFERAPAQVAAGTDYALDDLALASRLSFFLWSTIPDQRLLTLARTRQLSQPAVYAAEVRRMLKDPKAEALATRFAAQWLRLQDLEKVHPDAFLFPDFDQSLSTAMQRETELFFEDLVRKDRSVLWAFIADSTFVNEKLAKHYGIPGVSGEHFRPVAYPDAVRRGVLGQGSILVQTSLGNRTSPVLRGKWIMEVLLGTPPPPPPPNVPDLEQTEGAKEGRQLTTRERMEMHRSNATCKSCHQYIDPLGLALDAFDVTGRYRYRENGAQLDTRGQLWDGTKVSTPGELTKALTSKPIPLLRSFTDNLMTYALGRRVEDHDQPTVRAITRAAAAQNHRFSAYVLGVVNSKAFRTARAEPVAADGASH